MEIILSGMKVDSDTKISFMSNPKKVGSLACIRYDIYSKAKTIGEFLEITSKSTKCKKYARADLRWDFERKFIKIVK